MNDVSVGGKYDDRKGNDRGRRRFLTNDSMYFHGSMGFTEVGRFHNSGYKFGRWYDMIWMEKLIGPHDAHPGEVHFGEWNLDK